MVRVPEAFTVPQPPVKGMLKLNEPLAVGVPLIVIVLFNQDALTPAGKFVGAPIPVAPVVLWLILVNALLEQTVGLELAADAVLLGNCAATLNDELDGDEHAFEFVVVTE